MSKLNKWKKLAEEATLGPWGPDQHLDRVCSLSAKSVVPLSKQEMLTNALCILDDGEYIENRNKKNDAAFIAASREAVPVLIECLEIALDALHMTDVEREIREKLEGQ